jgi:hypothetical protein
MSGPQGSDANPWQASGPDQPAGGADRPAGSPSWQPPESPAPDQAGAQAAPAAPSWQPPGSEAPAWQPPAYPAAQYPQYGQPPVPPGYPAAQPYGPPPEYGAAPGQYPQPGPYGPPAQYGQYPPPPGGYPPPGQPGPYGQFPPGPADASKKSMRLAGGLLGGLAAVLIAVVLLLGFWKPGWFVTTKLDVTKAQQGVAQILSDESNGYGATNVQDVKCNNGQDPTVRKGDTFNCEVSIDGTKRQVTVTFQDDKGTYEVGRPK